MGNQLMIHDSIVCSIQHYIQLFMIQLFAAYNIIFNLFTITLTAIAFIIAAITIMGFFFIEYKSHIEYFWSQYRAHDIAQEVICCGTKRRF